MYPNLRLQLWRKHLRQNQLAQMLHIDESALSRILNGFRHPGPEMRKNIADLLESDEQWLFQAEDSEPSISSSAALRKTGEGA